MVLLEAKNIEKRFSSHKDPILRRINLTLSPGQIIAITGPSGGGKTTLLHILGTLDTPTSGKLLIEQQEVKNRKAAKVRNTSIGFIFQNFHLLEDYTVLENILFPAWIARQPIDKNSFAYRNTVLLLQKLGIASKMHSPAQHLSGGEKQRVAFARALCNNPKIILADEPSGNLDKANAKKMHQLLIYCAKRLDKGVIIVTHDPELAALCDRTYLLERGVLQ